jgi:hypothetical protein
MIPSVVTFRCRSAAIRAASSRARACIGSSLLSRAKNPLESQNTSAAIHRPVYLLIGEHPHRLGARGQFKQRIVAPGWNARLAGRPPLCLGQRENLAHEAFDMLRRTWVEPTQTLIKFLGYDAHPYNLPTGAIARKSVLGRRVQLRGSRP